MRWNTTELRCRAQSIRRFTTKPNWKWHWPGLIKNFRYGEDGDSINAMPVKPPVLRESLLMAMCIRDMMQGNSKLADIGRVEQSLGYNAIAAGFQGTTSLDRSISQW
ncbi:hypothetical protein ACLB1N_31380 [Escherichia coli]